LANRCLYVLLAFSAALSGCKGSVGGGGAETQEIDAGVPDADAPDGYEETNHDDVWPDAGDAPEVCDGGVLDPETGTCRPASCFDVECPPGEYCDPLDLSCRPRPQGDEPLFEAVVIVGHGGRGRQTGPAVQATLGSSINGTTVVDRTGRYVYIVSHNRVLRWDAATRQLSHLAGLGVPGYVDGPAEVALFDVNTYQSGGMGLSPDGSRLYLLDQQKEGGAVRVIDTSTGQVGTLAKSVLGQASGGPDSIRALALGRRTGTIYVTGWGDSCWKVTPEGDVTPLSLEKPTPVGFIAVDEDRGLIFGLDRNNGGPLYQWSIDGGSATLLNPVGVEGDRNDQYISDGPLSGMITANPSGLVLGPNGYLYIGGGDSMTMRRVDVDNLWVESMCCPGDGTYHWCVGDGTNNKCFKTWPSLVSFDDTGNGVFSYSVWPRTVMLRRLP